MQRIRIAYLIDTIHCDTAGTERQLLETIRRLDREGFEPTLICMMKSPWMELHELPCSTITLGYNGFIKPGFPCVIRRLCAILRQGRHHIVHTFFEESLFIGYLAKLLSGQKTALLASRRDIGLGKEAPWYHHLYGVLRPFVLRGFDGIIANADSVKAHLVSREGIPETRVVTIHNGVTVPGKREPEPPIFKGHHADVWIGLLANLRPIKRIDLFLHALSRLTSLRRHLDFKALILGDGPQKEHLVQLSRKLGLSSHVHFLGSIANPTAYLQRLDIGVLCSDREGFSNALLEYMACSLPVVATGVGGNSELIDGSNGFCVPPNNPEALARAMEAIILDRSLRESMGRSSLEKVTRNYSWEKSMNDLTSYYRTFTPEVTSSGRSLGRMNISRHPVPTINRI